jgi:hypothetical protein
LDPSAAKGGSPDGAAGDSDADYHRLHSGPELYYKGKDEERQNSNLRSRFRQPYRDRVHIAQTRSTYTFTTSKLPDQAGVDPFLLLIDRVPEDNVKKVPPSPSETSAAK